MRGMYIAILIGFVVIVVALCFLFALVMEVDDIRRERQWGEIENHWREAAGKYWSEH